MEEDQVFAEFDNIPKKRVRWNCGIAEAAENRCRNRFNDVLPYDDCSVKLKPSKDNKNGYINASHLRVSRAFIIIFGSFIFSIFSLSLLSDHTKLGMKEHLIANSDSRALMAGNCVSVRNGHKGLIK